MDYRPYAQHGEDAFILSMFPADFKGTVLEVGAYGPLNLSNSRLFIEAGWSAILVEPSPAPLRHLVQEYGNSPNVQIFAGAIGTNSDWSISKFDICDGPLSTDQPDAMEFWKNEAAFLGKLWVPVFPPWFFATWPCDFLSVDTEGNSIRVLYAMLQHHNEIGRLPKVICVEKEDERMDLLAQICERYGYRIVPHEPSAGVNRILRSVGF